jgi:hypothetical protein
MTSNPSFPSPFEDVSPAAAPDAPAGEFTVGVDLGQSFDPTAVAVIRKLHADTDRPIFQVGHLQRLPLQTSYPAVVNHVGRLISHLRGPSELVIDYTGVGRPVFDMFQVAGMSPIGVSITAGDVVANEGLVYRVPKLMLISRVQALLHSGQLKIHRGLADAPALVEELQSFRAQVTDQGFGASALVAESTTTWSSRRRLRCGGRTATRCSRGASSNIIVSSTAAVPSAPPRRRPRSPPSRCPETRSGSTTSGPAARCPPMLLS